MYIVRMISDIWLGCESTEAVSVKGMCCSWWGRKAKEPFGESKRDRQSKREREREKETGPLCNRKIFSYRIG